MDMATLKCLFSSSFSSKSSSSSPKGLYNVSATRSQPNMKRNLGQRIPLSIKFQVSCCTKFVQIRSFIFCLCVPDCHEYWVVKINLLIAFLPPNEPLFPWEPQYWISGQNILTLRDIQRHQSKHYLVKTSKYLILVPIRETAK